MAYDAHPNLAISHIVGGTAVGSGSGTTLLVTPGEGARFVGFPFNATLVAEGVAPDPTNSEIVRITGRTLDTLTIQRAAESPSTPLTTIGVGWRIVVSITRKTMLDLESQTVQVSGSAMTGPLTLSGAPTLGSHAATKDYVDAIAVAASDAKDACAAATTANITLFGAQTIDGVALVTDDRCLVKNQTTASQNGIYLVKGTGWVRAADANEDSEVTNGLYTFIVGGTVNAGTGWLLTTSGVIVVGTTPLTFTKFATLATPISIGNGGTGATTAPQALINLAALPLAGGTMTGALALSGAPTLATHAATKAYVDAVAGGNAQIYVEDYGWTTADAVGTTNRAAMRDAVKAAYDLITAGIGNVVITWRLSAGRSLVVPGTGTEVVNAAISTFNQRAWCVLDSNMTLIIPNYVEINYPVGYSGGSTGVHQFGIVSVTVGNTSRLTNDINIIINGVIDMRGGTFTGGADKVTAIYITGCRNSLVASSDGYGIVSNWYGADSGTYEAWGIVHNGCINAKTLNLRVRRTDATASGFGAQTAIASQYSYGYEVAFCRVEGVNGQGISSYSSRGLRFHHNDILGVGASALNIEYCDDWIIEDNRAGGRPQVGAGTAAAPITTVATGFTFGTATTVTLTSIAGLPNDPPNGGACLIMDDNGDWRPVSYTSIIGTTLQGVPTTGVGTATVTAGNKVELGPCQLGINILSTGSIMNGTCFGAIRRNTTSGHRASNVNFGHGIALKTVESAVALAGTTGTTLIPTGPSTYCKQAMKGLWVKVVPQSAAWSSVTAYVVGNVVTNGGNTYIAINPSTNSAPPSANWQLYTLVDNCPVVKVASVVTNTSFTTDTPHGGQPGDMIYMIRCVVEIEGNLIENNASGINHSSPTVLDRLMAQRHATRIREGNRFVSNVGNADIKGVRPSGSGTSWMATPIPVSVSAGGTVTAMAVPVVLLDQYVWNWTMFECEYEFDFSGITAGAGTGLIKHRGAGAPAPTSTKGGLDMTIVNNATDFGKLPTRWTFRLQPGESLLFLGGATGLSAAPTITFQRQSV